MKKHRDEFDRAKRDYDGLRIPTNYVRLVNFSHKQEFRVWAYAMFRSILTANSHIKLELIRWNSFESVFTEKDLILVGAMDFARDVIGQALIKVYDQRLALKGGIVDKV